MSDLNFDLDDFPEDSPTEIAQQNIGYPEGDTVPYVAEETSVSKRRITQKNITRQKKSPQMMRAFNALKKDPERYLAMSQKKAAETIGVDPGTLKKVFNKLKEEEPELNLPDKCPIRSFSPKMMKAYDALRENHKRYLRMKKTEAAKEIGVSTWTLRKAFEKLQTEEPGLNLSDPWSRKK